MKQSTLKRIPNTLEMLDEWNLNILIAVGLVISSPFIGIYQIGKYIYNKVNIKKSVSQQEIEREIEKSEEEIRRKKISDREIPLIVENHISPSVEGEFFFFEKRNFKIPYDNLVYVESEYNEKLHQFFEDNADWVDKWQRWHGWDIIKVDASDIKEGMMYPQDFAKFRHGFLWNSGTSTRDRESGIYGSIHLYYDIDTDSTVPIKEQMEIFMRRIYKMVDWA